MSVILLIVLSLSDTGICQTRRLVRLSVAVNYVSTASPGTATASGTHTQGMRTHTSAWRLITAPLWGGSLYSWEQVSGSSRGCGKKRSVRNHHADYLFDRSTEILYSKKLCKEQICSPVSFGVLTNRKSEGNACRYFDNDGIQ